MKTEKLRLLQQLQEQESHEDHHQMITEKPHLLPITELVSNEHVAIIQEDGIQEIITDGIMTINNNRDREAIIIPLMTKDRDHPK